MRATHSTEVDRSLFAQWLGTVHPASEQMYFLGMPVAHVVAYEDHRRKARLARIVALAARPVRSRIPA